MDGEKTHTTGIRGFSHVCLMRQLILVRIPSSVFKERTCNTVNDTVALDAFLLYV